MQFSLFYCLLFIGFISIVSSVPLLDSQIDTQGEIQPNQDLDRTKREEEPKRGSKKRDMVNDISDEVEEVFLKDSVKSDKVEPLPHLTTTSQAPTPIPSPHQNSTSSSTLSPSSTITTTQAPITSTQPKATEAPTSTTSKPVIHALKPHEKPTKDEDKDELGEEKEARDEIRKAVNEAKKGNEASTGKKLSASQLQQVYKIVKEINEENEKSETLHRLHDRLLMRKHHLEHEAAEDPVQHQLVHHPYTHPFYHYYTYPNDFYGNLYRNLWKRDLKGSDKELFSLLEKNSIVKEILIDESESLLDKLMLKEKLMGAEPSRFDELSHFYHPYWMPAPKPLYPPHDHHVTPPGFIYNPSVDLSSYYGPFEPYMVPHTHYHPVMPFAKPAIAATPLSSSAVSAQRYNYRPDQASEFPSLQLYAESVMPNVCLNYPQHAIDGFKNFISIESCTQPSGLNSFGVPVFGQGCTFRYSCEIGYEPLLGPFTSIVCNNGFWSAKAICLKIGANFKIKRDESDDSSVKSHTVSKRDSDEIIEDDYVASEEIEDSSSALGLNETYSDVKNDSVALKICNFCNDSVNSENETLNGTDVMLNVTDTLQNETINLSENEEKVPEQSETTDDPSINASPILEGSIEWSTMKNNDLDKTLYETFYELLGADSKSNFSPFASILFKKK